MASTSSKCKEAPSAFASLLRRSRFASYDPKIAQIYTTYDGHAHRGNWGLKRPLALHRKSGDLIVLKAVDSNEQQTEWYRAEREARWLRTASELGKEVHVREDFGSWYVRMGQRWQKTYDSDYNFDPAKHSCFGPNILANAPQPSPTGSKMAWPSTDYNRIQPAHSPNPLAMNPAELRRYLAYLRRLRPKFKRLMDADMKAHREPPADAPAFQYRSDLNYLNIAHDRFHLLPYFLSKGSSPCFEIPHSASLRPSPHHNAGWSYSHTSDLTNKILHRPVPGRIFNEITVKSKSRNTGDVFALTAGVAGHLGKLSNHDALYRKAIKLSDQEGHLNPVQLRPKSIILSHAPTVVGATADQTGFKGTDVRLDLVEEARLRSLMSNPYRPGSQAYVAHNDPHGGRGTQFRALMSAKSQTRAARRIPPGKSQQRVNEKAKRINEKGVRNLNQMLGNIDLANVKGDLS